MEITIVGGGVSGLIAGITLARNGKKVTILEKNNKCCKKLLLTGNGRCNFWNQNVDSSFYHASNMELLEELLNLKKDLVLDFIKSIGIIEKNINGYYYPYTNQALSVYNAILNTANNLDIKIEYECEVIKIEKKDKFIITTNKGIYRSDKLILAMGGATYPKTGSDGSGYKFAKALGHSINKLLPVLTKLKGNYNYKDLKGVRAEVRLTLEENNQKIKSEDGELIFTDEGISGICVYNLSGDVIRGLANKKNEKILINFVPWFKGSNEELIKFLDREEEKTNYTLSQILEGFLNYKLVNMILKKLKINNTTRFKDVDKMQVVNILREYPFIPTNGGDILDSQVTSGGVPLEEVDIKKLESKKVKDLYLTGEILDVDGVCGGYNLGFAIMCGLIVGDMSD